MRRISLLLLSLAWIIGASNSTPPLRFTEGAKEAGVDFLHVSGSPQKKLILESMSGGVALFDFDNDGFVDIYLVNGNSIEDLLAGKRQVRNGLFRNRGDGHFEDVTQKAGVAGGRWDMGAVAADIDNDGWLDLFVTGFGRNTLYRNRGDGTFEDITERAGLTDSLWSSGAAFGDYDGDGLLDLAVVHYVQFDPANPPPRNSLCRYRGVDVQCGPRGLPGTEDRLFRNLGGGKFQDVSSQTGILTGYRYYGLGCIWSDYDDDGDLDLFVANDSCPNFLFRNDGGHFLEVAVESGVGFNEDGREQAGMGVDFGDVDGDGSLDLIQTNFSDDKNTLYRNLGGHFSDASHIWRLGEISWQTLGWGAVFLDADLDGWLDLFISNGHVYPEVEQLQVGTHYRQRDFLFHNEAGKRFEEVGVAAGLEGVWNSRGAAAGDLDNDGRIDLVVNHLDAAPGLYWNRTPVEGRHWIGLDLRGPGGRPAIGAKVTVESGGRKRIAEVHAGGSYLSQNDSRLVFGLGDGVVESIRIRWPSGSTETIALWELDRYNRFQVSR